MGNTDPIVIDILSDHTLPAEASQTIEIGDHIWLNENGRWVLCPTTFSSGLTGISKKKITTAAGEIDKILPALIIGQVRGHADGVVDENDALGPSTNHAGDFSALTNLDAPAAYAEATVQAEFDKIMKKKGSAKEAAADDARFLMWFNGIGGF